jgi:hypothetical protein
MWSGLGILLVIVVLNFFISMFYYTSWMLTDKWLSDSDTQEVAPSTPAPMHPV